MKIHSFFIHLLNMSAPQPLIHWSVRNTARYEAWKPPAFAKLTGYQGRQATGKERGTNSCY